MACLINNLKCQIFFQHLQYLCKCLLFLCRLQSCLCPFTLISLFLHILVSRNFGFVVISNINRSQYTGLFMRIRFFLFLLLIHFLKNNLLHHSLVLIQNKSSGFRCWKIDISMFPLNLNSFFSKLKYSSTRKNLFQNHFLHFS